MKKFTESIEYNIPKTFEDIEDLFLPLTDMDVKILSSESDRLKLNVESSINNKNYSLDFISVFVLLYESQSNNLRLVTNSLLSKYLSFQDPSFYKIIVDKLESIRYRCNEMKWEMNYLITHGNLGFPNSECKISVRIYKIKT